MLLASIFLSSRRSRRGTRQGAQRRHHRQAVGQDGGKRGVRGFDAGKKVSGRKRHLLVDTLGLLIGVLVHSATIQDRDGGRILMAAQLGKVDEPRSRLRTRLTKVWADSAYAGAFETFLESYGVQAEISRRPGEGPKVMWVAPGEEPLPREAGFHLVPHRWIVERTIAWLNRYRRLAKDYEHHIHIAEAWVCMASIRIMLASLGNS